MTTYQNNRGEKWLLVPVPDECKNPILADRHIGYDWIEYKSKYGCTKIPIPPANYTLICTSDEITEEQAALIVDCSEGYNQLTCYRNYRIPPDSYVDCLYAKQSFQSLLHSLNLSRVVVLKIEE